MEKRKTYKTKKQPAKTKPLHFPWADYINITVTPQDIQSALWEAGVTKKEHLNTKPNAVIGALMSAYGVDLGSLRVALKEKDNDGTNK